MSVLVFVTEQSVVAKQNRVQIARSLRLLGVYKHAPHPTCCQVVLRDIIEQTEPLTIHQLMFRSRPDCHRGLRRKEKLPNFQQHTCLSATVLFSIAKSLDRGEKGLVGDGRIVVVLVFVVHDCGA